MGKYAIHNKCTFHTLSQNIIYVWYTNAYVLQLCLQYVMYIYMNIILIILIIIQGKTKKKENIYSICSHVEQTVILAYIYVYIW